METVTTTRLQSIVESVCHPALVSEKRYEVSSLNVLTLHEHFYGLLMENFHERSWFMSFGRMGPVFWELKFDADTS